MLRRSHRIRLLLKIIVKSAASAGALTHLRLFFGALVTAQVLMVNPPRAKTACKINPGSNDPYEVSIY